MSFINYLLSVYEKFIELYRYIYGLPLLNIILCGHLFYNLFFPNGLLISFIKIYFLINDQKEQIGKLCYELYVLNL